MRLRLPAERPTEPPTGYKIAHPVLSQDGTRAGFTGVSLGGALPYGVLADASCVYGLRHRAPHRRCDCGFHCVHDRAVAEGLLCTAEHRSAVLLDVTVLGAYIRFERGFRYARQRVRTATVGPCACGTVAAALADAGRGRPGWLALAPACAGCVRGRTSVSLAAFARLAGEGLRVVAGSASARQVAELVGVEGLGVPELTAEAALLQARLDWFQTQLARLGERGPGESGEGAGS
ncbi:hypothetical protein [Streptomyces pseudovenezuelae]|uniref:Uncharacterized protein n=1 Tax=Streptomyces pseudovenezuelae TaxID=67350 RepID=A0ABT6LIM1_9ACTN|nr:hypothetical protein [Streptomyces pseudovenezuelae]MDH6216155.1 hypothetical protein [Streptomyces pseudovenezuelae]